MKHLYLSKILLALAIFFMPFIFAGAQNNLKITGHISDAAGNPVCGAGVFIAGTKAGTVSDLDGNYEISNVPSDSKLSCLCLGYQEASVDVNGRTKIDIVLQENSMYLDEVMVVAYGTAKKESFTGSASVVKADDIRNRVTGNVTKSLEGSIAGVQMTSGGGQPGEDAKLLVRGAGSINASALPLYVVDGVPYDGAISSINPADIESVTVLKDASAGALYGARGANGVVVITTKKGDKEKANIYYKGNAGISSRALKRYDLLDMDEFVEITYEALRNAAQYGKGMDFEAASSYAAANLGTTLGGIKNPEYYNPYKNYAWSDLIDRSTGKIKSDATAAWNAGRKGSDNWMDNVSDNSAFRNEHIFSISGGSEKADYLMSVGYYDEKGTLIGTDFTRYTGRIGGNVQAREWLKVGMNANFARSKSQLQDASGSETSNVWYTAQFIGPIYPLYLKDMDGNNVLDENGGIQYEYGDEDDNGYANRVNAQGFNSLAELKNNPTSYIRNALSGRGYVTFGTTDESSPIYGLTGTANFGFDFNDFAKTAVKDKYHGNMASQGGSVSKTNTRIFSYTANALLNYNRAFGSHSVNLLAGAEYYRYNFNYALGEKSGIVDGIAELSPAVTTMTNTSYSEDYAITSALARVNYGYAGRYYFDASFRADGSSRFSPEHRCGIFWSVGASWRISQEQFMAGTSSWLNNLTLKASYGVQGNDNLGSYYAWQGLFDYGWNNGSRAGALASSIENREVTWEKNGNFNTGIEAAFLSGKLHTTIEFYSRKTRDMLLNNPIAISSGFKGYDDNVGSMVNRGLESTVTYTVFDNKNFHWDATLLTSLNRNRVQSLTSSQSSIKDNIVVIEEGKPIYTFYLPKSAGVSAATGEQLYWAYYKYAVSESGAVVPVKCDPYVTDDTQLAALSKYYYGSRQALFSGSFSSRFVFLGSIDLSFMLSYSVGGKIYDSLYNDSMNVTFAGNNWHRNVLRRWQKPGDVTDVPRVEIASGRLGCGEDLIDASYLALKNITLGYTFPSAIMSRTKIEKLRVFLTGDNLFLFSHLDGMDPQYNFTGTTSYTYTPSRVIVAGLEINF